MYFYRNLLMNDFFSLLVNSFRGDLSLKEIVVFFKLRELLINFLGVKNISARFLHRVSPDEFRDKKKINKFILFPYFSTIK